MPRLTAILILAAVASATPPPAVRLLFGGDVQLSRGVAAEIIVRGQPWAALAPSLHAADFAMANLEGAVGVQRECVRQRLVNGESMCFAIPPVNIPPLAAAGFVALGSANNHDADLGASGTRQTAAALRAAHLDDLTADASPLFVTVRGVRIGLVGFSAVPGVDGHSLAPPSVALAQRLRLAHAFSQLVVAFVHWGTELDDWPSVGQIQQARWLIEHGADVVIGSHPHVIEAPACVRDHPVFYSLGNLLFDQRYPATRTGMLADCRINDDTLSCGAETVRAENRGFFPQTPQPDPAVNLSACPVRLHSPIVMDGFTLSTATAADGERRIEASRGGHMVWATLPGQLLTASPAPLQDRLGEPLLFTLERHPSVLDHEDAARPYIYALTARGPVARWRGTALAWPLRDAEFLPGTNGILCALHRGDSFLALNPAVPTSRLAAYRWDGFGFKGNHDVAVLHRCLALLGDEVAVPPTLVP